MQNAFFWLCSAKENVRVFATKAACKTALGNYQTGQILGAGVYTLKAGLVNGKPGTIVYCRSARFGAKRGKAVKIACGHLAMVLGKTATQH